MSKIYRFKNPIYLKDGTVIGNANPRFGDLGGEAFLGDPPDDNETAKAIIAQCEKEKAEAEAKAGKPQTKKA